MRWTYQFHMSHATFLACKHALETFSTVRASKNKLPRKIARYIPKQRRCLFESCSEMERNWKTTLCTLSVPGFSVFYFKHDLQINWKTNKQRQCLSFFLVLVTYMFLCQSIYPPGSHKSQVLRFGRINRQYKLHVMALSCLSLHSLAKTNF